MAPEIRELYVRRYKNLSEVRVSLGRRGVLYGENGVGKTNLLEALTLAAGTQRALAIAARRLVTPGPGAIEIVEAPWDGRGATAEHLVDWWDQIGVSDLPDSWEEGIGASWLSDEIKAVLVDTSNLGVRFSLVEVEGLDAVAAYDRGQSWRKEQDEDPPTISRKFDRTLCLARHAVPDLALLKRAGVPSVSALLEEDVTKSIEWTDLLALPPSWPVVGVSWLSAERSDDDLWADYERCVAVASAGLGRFMATAKIALRDLAVPEFNTDDARWVAAYWFAAATKQTVGKVLDTLDIDPGDSWLDLLPSDDRSVRVIGSPGDQSWVSQLSSGERFLVDEAMLDAEEMLALYHRRLVMAEAFLLGIDKDDLQLEILYRDDPFGTAEYWDYGEVERLINVMYRIVADRHTSATADLLFGPPMPLLRVCDEPERHLHPRAQRARAEQIHERASSGQVLVSTHALPFLGRPGWDHHHIYRTAEGTVVSSFDPTDMEILMAVANTLGVTGGELLSRYRYVLYVEGLHDKAFLEETQGSLLRDYAILVLPLHGLDNVIQVADSQLVGRFLDAGVGVLADHSLTKAGTPAPTKVKESRLLADLRKEVSRRGRKVDEFRLRRPDIIAYLPDEVVQEDAPMFPGFKVVHDTWKRRYPNADFKTLASELADGFRFDEANVRRLARRTAEQGNSYPDDFRAFLAELATAASHR